METKNVTLKAPTDRIISPHGEFRKAYAIWCGNGKNKCPPYVQRGQTFLQGAYVPVVPIDLITSETVPMPDFQIVLGENLITFNTLFPNDVDGYEVHVRTDDFAFVYRVKDDMSGWESSPFMNTSVAAKKWYYGNSEEQVAFRTLRALLLADWYAIQMLALHPTMREVFSSPRVAPLRKENKNRKKKQRVAGFIRTHYISEADIEQKCGRDFERRTMAWYVIGHYRHYKSGRKKFIKGYWKGPLRDAKRNLDEGRERIIVQ